MRVERTNNPSEISYRATDSSMSLLPFYVSRVKNVTSTARWTNEKCLLNKGAGGVLSGSAGYFYILLISFWIFIAVEEFINVMEVKKFHKLKEILQNLSF